MLTEPTYGDHGECRSCGHRPLLGSLSRDARNVLLQIEHSARKEYGLCPTAQEVAKLIGWDLVRVLEAIKELVQRDILADVPEGMEAPEGAYWAKLYGWDVAMKRMELRAQKAEGQLIDPSEANQVIKEQRAEIGRLKSVLGRKKGLEIKAANEALRTRCKALETALAEARAHVETLQR